MTRSRRSVTAALALLALTAAACGRSSKMGAASTAADAKEIELKVGLLYTTSGQGGDLASSVLGAVKLASDEAAKRKVKITVNEADYAGDTTKVDAAVQGLATKSDAIVVGTDDPDILPPLAGVSGPILHSFITADDAVPSEGSVFRLAPSDKLEAKRLVTFLTEHRKYTRIAIISDDTTFGKAGRLDVQNALSEAGVSPVGDYVFTPGGDIHTPVAAAGQRSAQAVILWVSSPGEAARIVVDVHHSNLAYQLALSGNLGTATFAKNASAQVTPVAFRDGMLSVGTWAGPWFTLERIVRFYRDFRAANSALAPVQSAAVYDAIMALAAAARTHGTDASSIAAGLESLKDFEAAGVPLTFGPGKHEGVDLDDVAVYGFTKTQTAPGGEFAPDVDTGGGFFTVVVESLDLPSKYAYLTAQS